MAQPTVLPLGSPCAGLVRVTPIKARGELKCCTGTFLDSVNRVRTVLMRIRVFFFLIYFLIGGYLLYSIVLASAIHQHEESVSTKSVGQTPYCSFDDRSAQSLQLYPTLGNFKAALNS